MSEAGADRRLTTVLAAGVVGDSRLMAADEAGTLVQFKTHRKELIEPKTGEHPGRVVKLIGDGTPSQHRQGVDMYQSRMIPMLYIRIVLSARWLA